MKLSDQLLRKPVYVAFGQAAQGGLTSVDLAASRTASSVTITASDGSAAPIPAADTANAGMMSGADKAKLDALTVATTRGFASRAAAQAATLGAEVTHIRTGGYAAEGDRGGALYRRVASQPAHGLRFQSADGAWWELVPEGGALNVRQAGAVGDGTTDDHAAFAAAISAFLANVNPVEQGSVRVVVPEGTFYLGATLHIRSSVILEGQGVSKGTGGASTLKWPADTAGIVIHRNNTSPSGAEVPDDTATKAGDGSVIRNLALSGAGSFGSAADGIWLRGAATVEECVVMNFARDGIHIEAGAATGGLTEGNANIWRIANCRLIGNRRHGLFVDGADTNAGTAISIDSSSNGRWGIFDSSFLGNSYLGCHCATNGLAGIAGNTGSSFVHYKGPENGDVDKRYAANVAASEAALAGTVPGTSAAVWIEIANGGPSARIPTWLPGQAAGTWFHGGALQTDNANARNIFVGCYTEGDQAPAQIVKPTQVLNGLHAAGVRGTGLHVDGNSVKLGNFGFDPRSDDAVAGMVLDLRRSANSLIYANVTGDHVSGTQFLGWDNIDKAWAFGKHANLDARIGMKLTTDLTGAIFGRTAALGGGYPFFPRGVIVGGSFFGRLVNYGSAAPASGAFARGDIVLNTSPTATGTFGWVCVAAGSPGTWTELAVVAKPDWDTAKADIADLKSRVTALESA